MSKEKQKKFKLIPHHFELDTKRSETKGDFIKGKSGLLQIATENKYIYSCGKCFSDIQLSVKVKLDELNLEMAYRFECLP